jgi:hypothetical protein
MRAHPTRPKPTTVYVAGGYGVKITVHRGRLVVHDGVAADRRTARFNRIGGLSRLVILGRSGYVPRLITGKHRPDPRASAPSATVCLARQTE